MVESEEKVIRSDQLQHGCRGQGEGRTTHRHHQLRQGGCAPDRRSAEACGMHTIGPGGREGSASERVARVNESGPDEFFLIFQNSSISTFLKFPAAARFGGSRGEVGAALSSPGAHSRSSGPTAASTPPHPRPRAEAKTRKRRKCRHRRAFDG